MFVLLVIISPRVSCLVATDSLVSPKCFIAAHANNALSLDQDDDDDDDPN